MPVAQSQNWPRITSAWLVPLIWPLLFFVLFLIVHGVNISTPDLGDLLTLGLVLLALIVLTMPLLYLKRYLPSSFWKTPKNAYACPECGNDIHQTPHRCCVCGAKLVWGHLLTKGQSGLDRRI